VWKQVGFFSGDHIDAVRRLNEVYHSILYITELSFIACYFYLGSVSTATAESPPRTDTTSTIFKCTFVTAEIWSTRLPLLAIGTYLVADVQSAQEDAVVLNILPTG